MPAIHQRAFVCKDDKSDKFWFLRMSANAYAVTYGKTGTQGRTEFKEFDSDEECSKQAEKQIAAKLKKGYIEQPDFDFSNRFYFDDEEIGPHILTTHPRFCTHFKDDFYYDCTAEDAPFGSDEGADTLVALEEHMKKHRDVDIAEFAQKLVADEWGLAWLPPDNIDKEIVEKQLAQQTEPLPMSQLMMNSDQVIVATTLGQIKIMGEVSLRNRDMALRSLLRLQIIAKIEDFEQSELYNIMYKDLLAFENTMQQPSELCRQLIDYLACPCIVFDKLLDDDNMIYAYEKALREGLENGYTPLLVIADETLFEQLTMAVDEASDMDFDFEKVKTYRKTTIEKAAKIDVQKFFQEHLSEISEDEKITIGSVKSGQTMKRFSSFWSYDTNLSKEVILAKIPVTKPWELASWVPMGGFNDCPLPEEQVAIMKYWYEKYKACPGCVSYDTWEFILPEPAVTQKDAAIDLALEQYAFCYDRVEQYGGENYCTGTLADTLLRSTVWYFWWD